MKSVVVDVKSNSLQVENNNNNSCCCCVSRKRQRRSISYHYISSNIHCCCGNVSTTTMFNYYCNKTSWLHLLLVLVLFPDSYIVVAHNPLKRTSCNIDKNSHFRMIQQQQTASCLPTASIIRSDSLVNMKKLAISKVDARTNSFFFSVLCRRGGGVEDNEVDINDDDSIDQYIETLIQNIDDSDIDDGDVSILHEQIVHSVDKDDDLKEIILNNNSMNETTLPQAEIVKMKSNNNKKTKSTFAPSQTGSKSTKSKKLNKKEEVGKKKVTHKIKKKNELIKTKISKGKSIRKTTKEPKSVVSLKTSTSAKVSHRPTQEKKLKKKKVVVQTSQNDTSVLLINSSKEKKKVVLQTSQTDTKKKQDTSVLTNLNMLNVTSQDVSVQKMKKQKSRSKTKLPEPSSLSSSTATTTTNTSLRRPIPPLPPNKLYRFLLRQGRIGQTIVFTFIIISEFTSTYVPPVAYMISYLWKRFGPPPPPPPRRRLRPDEAFMSNDIYSTPKNKKQRKAIVRMADEYAINQLKRLGSVQQARYRYISTEFMKRYGLGTFASSAAAAVLEKSAIDSKRMQTDSSTGTLVKPISETKKAESLFDRIIPFTGTKQQQPTSPDKSDSRNPEIDWVLQSLTQPISYNKKQGGHKWMSKLEIPHFHSSLGKILNAEKVQGMNYHLDIKGNDMKKEISTRHRLSDRDGGDGIVGRIRAVSGTNSLLSRSLLGAYPGDAVPPSDAANANGISAIAMKYGWGEWDSSSDDDDDNETTNNFSDNDNDGFFDNDNDMDQYSQDTDFDSFGEMPDITSPSKMKRRKKMKKKKRRRFDSNMDHDDSQNLLENIISMSDSSVHIPDSVVDSTSRLSKKKKTKRRRKKRSISSSSLDTKNDLNHFETRRSKGHHKKKKSQMSVEFNLGSGIEVGFNFGATTSQQTTSSTAKNRPIYTSTTSAAQQRQKQQQKQETPLPKQQRNDHFIVEREGESNLLKRPRSENHMKQQLETRINQSKRSGTTSTVSSPSWRVQERNNRLLPNKTPASSTTRAEARLKAKLGNRDENH